MVTSVETSAFSTKNPYENPSSNGWENAQNVGKMAKKMTKFAKIIKNGQKRGKMANVWTALEAKPFDLGKIRKQFWMRMDLKFQKKLVAKKVAHNWLRKCAKTSKKHENLQKTAFFLATFGFCGFTPWRRLGGNFLHKRWIKAENLTVLLSDFQKNCWVG